MSLSYKKLFHLLIDKEIKDADFRKIVNISVPTMIKLKNNKAVSSETIEKICKTLECQPGDIMEYIEEDRT